MRETERGNENEIFEYFFGAREPRIRRGLKRENGSEDEPGGDRTTIGTDQPGIVGFAWQIRLAVSITAGRTGACGNRGTGYGERTLHRKVYEFGGPQA